MLDQISTLQSNPASFTKTAMSVIRLDATGTEIARTNLYEVWPYRLNFFNPTRTLNESYLIDVFMAFDSADTP